MHTISIIIFGLVHSTIVYWSTTSYTTIATGYLIVGIVALGFFFMFSGVIRCELNVCGTYLFNGDCSDVYNRVVTLHGLGMVFLFIMPVVISFAGNWLLPQSYIAMDFATPRINIASLWALVHAVLWTYMAATREEGIGTGWTIYMPLSTFAYHSSLAVSMLVFVIHILGLSSEGGSLTFLVSLVLSRSTGTMSNWYCLFVWCIAVVSILLVTTLPVLGAAVTVLLLDRVCNVSLLSPSSGGDVVMYQHLFWFFGHPEVYVIILPVFGLISSTLVHATGRTAFGHTSMVYAILSIALVGYFVWAHHMFTVGMSEDARLYFSSATAIIGIPTAVKIFSWLTSILSARIWTINTMLVVSFLVCFTIGGFTGIILSNAGIDIAYHDTYYVVAHFHYVLSIGAMIGAILIVLLYLISYVGYTGDSVVMSILVSVVIGINVLFMLQHLIGIEGHPRRVYLVSDIYTHISTVCNVGFVVILLSIIELTGLTSTYSYASVAHHTPSRVSIDHNCVVSGWTEHKPVAYLYNVANAHVM